MELKDPEDRGGLAEALRVGLPFTLTIGVAALGVFAAVALAGREQSRPGPAPETLPTPAVVVEPKPMLAPPGPSVPKAVIFLVSSEEARAQVAGVLEAESTVRMTIHEPPRRSWIVVVDSQAQAETVFADAAIPDDSGLPIQVVDFR